MARPAVLTVADTIARSFLLAAQTRGDRPAIREKKFRHLAADQLAAVAACFQGNCLRPATPSASGRGDVASIIAKCGAGMGLCRHGHPVRRPAFPAESIRPIPPVQVEYLINDSRTKVIFAEDEEQLDKILACRARCPTLEKIVVFDMEGLSGFIDPMVMSLARIHGARKQSLPGPRKRCGTRWSQAAAPTISPSWSIPPAPQARPRGAMHSNRGVTHQMRPRQRPVSVQ